MTPLARLLDLAKEAQDGIGWAPPNEVTSRVLDLARVVVLLAGRVDAIGQQIEDAIAAHCEDQPHIYADGSTS